MQKTKFASHKQYFWKDTTQKLLKVGATKNLFFSVYIWYNWLRWMFFYCLWKLEHIFHKSLWLLWSIFNAMLLLSLKQAFWRIPDFMRYLLNKSLMLMARFQKRLLYILHLLNFRNLFYFSDCSSFFVVNEFF